MLGSSELSLSLGTYEGEGRKHMLSPEDSEDESKMSTSGKRSLSSSSKMRSGSSQ